MINYVNTTGDQNITGIKTDNSMILCSVTTLTSNQLVNKKQSGHLEYFHKQKKLWN